MKGSVGDGGRRGGEHNLSGAGDRSNTRGQVYAAPRVLASCRHRPVGVHTDPEHWREPVGDAVSGQPSLQRHGAADCILGAIERRKHAVPRSVHEFAPMLVDELIDKAIMPLQEMTPRVIADRRHQWRRIADVREHERPRRRLRSRPGRSLRRTPGESIAKRSPFWRWTDPGFLLQPTSEIRVRLDRLCQVAAPGENRHEISIAALAQRLPLDEGSCRTLCRDQLITAEAQAGGRDALESPPLDLAQVTPLHVDPGSLSARQERTAGRVQGDASRWPRRRPVSTRDSRLGSVDRFGGSLGVYERRGRQPELHMRLQFQTLPEEPAQPLKEPVHVVVCDARRRFWPERPDQFWRLHGRQATDDEVGEQDAFVASRQTLVQAAPAHGRARRPQS